MRSNIVCVPKHEHEALSTAPESGRVAACAMDGAMDADEAINLPSWSRTYADYRSRFVDAFKLPLSPNKTIVLEQRPNVSAEHAKESKHSADGSCTASTVWDAGIVLATHVFHKSPAASSSGRLLDLGAGTGIVGLAAAASGRFRRVVLSDLPTVVPLLERNASANAKATNGTNVDVLPLTWDDDQMLDRAASSGPFDVIVGGDLLYRPQVIPPLLHALKRLATRDTVILLAASLQHSPETIRLFASKAQEEDHAGGFVVEYLGREAAMPCNEWHSEEVRVLRLTRRKERGREEEVMRQGASSSSSAAAVRARGGGDRPAANSSSGSNGGGGGGSGNNIVPRSLTTLEDKIAALERELAEMSSEESDEDDDDEEEGPPRAPAKNEKRSAPLPPTTKPNKVSKAAKAAQASSSSSSSSSGPTCIDVGPKGASNGTASAAAAAPLSLRCAVCNVSVTSEELMREHLRGRKHQQAQKVHDAKSEGRYCDLCGIVFTGEAQLIEHRKGRKHREKAGAMR